MAKSTEKILTDPQAGKVLLVKSDRSRSISIRVHPVKGVRVSVPRIVPFAAAVAFYKMKRNWVLEVMARQRELAQAGYMVYALDSRGQGANERLDEYHYKDMATDVYEFIRLKGLEKPAVFGFSDGGIIALQLEVMYPGTLGAIVTGGANIFVWGALVPEFEQGFLAQPSDEPLVKMMQNEPAMTVEDMAGIKVPALIMSGENDLILADHTRLIGSNIPDGRVKIIEGEDHGSYICNSPKLAPLMLDFFREIGY